LPSYTDIVVKLVANALAECPELNACWYDDGIYVYDDINIGVAVDTEAGLVAPVINDVSSCSLDDVAEQSRALVEQARAGTLSQSQLQGGTFTVTSLGMFDIDYFTPIINLPQSAILGIGRIVQEPVVRGDDIVIGATMGLSLTFDHRVIDGAPAARWLQQLSQFFQQPAQHVHRI
jgi:pyruvate dehydrogenase E2 component (dihydrolipoamide acetyltransferase)